MTWFSSVPPLLPEVIDLHGQWRGEKLALVDHHSRRTWSELARDVSHVDRQLRGADTEPGQRIAVLASNSAQVLIAYLGIIRAGAVVVPLNTYVSNAGIAAMLEDCDAVAVIADAEQAVRLGGFKSWPTGLKHRWLLDGPRTPWTVLRTTGASEPLSRITLKDDAECNIIYSSGTTGRPKGIVHTHRPRLDWAYDLALALRYHSGAVTLLSLGLFSNISWAAMLATLLMGGTLVVMPKFDANDFVQFTKQHGATHSALVPIQLQHLMALPERQITDMATLQQLMCCGSPLHFELKRRIIESLPAQLTELYGLTEGIITTLDPEAPDDKMRSVGKPLQGTDIKIIANDGSEQPTGAEGEIVGFGRILMAGYNNRADANEEASWTDQYGRKWLRTGDIGKLDEDGYLYLVDRKKDMIISGGQNIYPADIESVIASHPSVSEVAVIGVPSERWGETPIALAVIKEPIATAKLMTWINQRVGKQQRVANVVIVDELPRNPNGKVLKRRLRAGYAHWMDGQPADDNNKDNKQC